MATDSTVTKCTVYTLFASFRISVTSFAGFQLSVVAGDDGYCGVGGPFSNPTEESGVARKGSHDGHFGFDPS